MIPHDTGHDVTTYHDISCDITYIPWYTTSLRIHHANRNSTKTHRLVAVYCFFRVCLSPHLGLSSVCLFCRPESFCCPSAVHIMGLTVPPAKSNLVPSGLGLLPERMYVCFVSFFFFLCFVFFLSLSFFLLDAWYLVLLRL